MGNTTLETDRPAKDKHVFKRVLGIQQSKLLSDVFSAVVPLVFLGCSAREMGLLAELDAIFKRTIAISESTLGIEGL